MITYLLNLSIEVKTALLDIRWYRGLMELRKTIGKNIQELRTDRGYSQDQLASILRLNKQTIWRVEAGLTDIGADRMEAVAVALKVDPSALLANRKRPSIKTNGNAPRQTKKIIEIEKCLANALKLLRAYRQLLSESET